MRENQVMFDPPAPLSNNDSLLIALFLAAVIHVVIGLGINFTAPQPEQVSRSIDITLVNMPTQKAPEKAQLLAQENQLGAGEQSKCNSCIHPSWFIVTSVKILIKSAC